MKEKTVVIKNKLGLHARAAAKLVKEAKRFSSEITILKDDNHLANAKSIMGVMMLAATKGTKLKLSATGRDAIKALEALEALINNRFGESE